MKPTVAQFVPRDVGSRAWGTERLVAETEFYTLKVNTYLAGKAGGLAYHRLKTESFHLLSGEGWLDYDRGQGLERMKLTAGMTVTIPAGAVHRFEAITDVVGVEASTPQFNDRVRVEEEYGVPVIGDSYGLPTTP
jgi:mannose-6-phosphate isomerase-like protein (cupin superfamily)